MKRVAVGLSGGVDSAVAAALLVRAGYDVVGVMMTIWDGRPLPAETSRHACYGPGEADDVADARRVAATLGIPLEVVDLSQEYNAEVLAVTQRQYALGFTPNPCLYCNRRVKFGLMPQRLRAKGLALDYFATGHYARIAPSPDGARYRLLRGVDRAKDQSYFLYWLTQDELAQTLFPLGSQDKATVRQTAEAFALPVADKAESQDFMAGGYRTLFGSDERPGPILDDAGRVLGEHRGIHQFTIGQRRGLGVAARQPLYVTQIDERANAVIVGSEERLLQTTLVAAELSWMPFDVLDKPRIVEAQVRYRHAPARATITPLDQDRVRVDFEVPQKAIAPGQAVVFYEGDSVVGGGLIQPSA